MPILYPLAQGGDLWDKKPYYFFSVAWRYCLPLACRHYASFAGYLTLRRPHVRHATWVEPAHQERPGFTNAVRRTRGLGIMLAKQDGRQGALRALILITHLVNEIEQAEPHGIAVQRKQNPEQF